MMTLDIRMHMENASVKTTCGEETFVNIGNGAPSRIKTQLIDLVSEDNSTITGLIYQFQMIQSVTVKV